MFTYASILTRSLIIILGCSHFDEIKDYIPCVVCLINEGKTPHACKGFVTSFAITQCLKIFIPSWKTPPDPVLTLSQAPLSSLAGMLKIGFTMTDRPSFDQTCSGPCSAAVSSITCFISVVLFIGRRQLMEETDLSF